MLLASAREVLLERVEFAGGPCCRLCALEDPRGRAVSAPIGSLEHLAGNPLIDGACVSGTFTLAALGEPQPQVDPGRAVPRCRTHASRVIVAEKCIDYPARVSPLQRCPRRVLLELPGAMRVCGRPQRAVGRRRRHPLVLRAP